MLLQVEVLVNTTSRDLSQGAISKSILGACGREIQDEIYQIPSNSFLPGKVFPTDAYNLEDRGVQLVCHGILQKWTDVTANIGVRIFFESC
jgi:O-acetyl-ADP-ribose deacetylase (regulator of RNase III)